MKEIYCIQVEPEGLQRWEDYFIGRPSLAQVQQALYDAVSYNPRQSHLNVAYTQCIQLLNEFGLPADPYENDMIWCRDTYRTAVGTITFYCLCRARETE